MNLQPDELEHLRKQAREGESDSNLIRRLLKLKPLTHGGIREKPNEILKGIVAEELRELERLGRTGRPKGKVL